MEYTIESFEEELVLAKLRISSLTIQFGELWAKVINVLTICFKFKTDIITVNMVRRDVVW